MKASTWARALVASSVALLALGCHQYRSVPLGEATKLSTPRFSKQRAVQVRDVDGDKVVIGSFRYFDVGSRVCEYNREAVSPYDVRCRTRYQRNVAPVEVEQIGTTLRVTSWDPDTNGWVTREHTHVDHVRLADKSYTRPLIIVVTAVAAYFAAATPVFLAIPQREGIDLAPVFFPVLAGAAAAGISLAITIPLTRPLGSGVE